MHATRAYIVAGLVLCLGIAAAMFDVADAVRIFQFGLVLFLVAGLVWFISILLHAFAFERSGKSVSPNANDLSADLRERGPGPFKR